MTENHLVIFLKNPVPGSVKQRLARHIGAEQAARVYKKISEMVISKTAPTRTDLYTVDICFSPQRDEAAIRAWLVQHKSFYPQTGSNLGQRMSNAFKRAFESKYKKVALIGTDCPEISRDIILQSFALLDWHHVVLGPAYDGGYYLIGLREMFPDLFQNIAWGSEKVFTQTIEKIYAAGFSVGLLPMLRDIDRPEDLDEYQCLY